MLTVTYMLELSEEELMNLFVLLSFFDALGKLDEPEKLILDKVQHLAEGK